MSVSRPVAVFDIDGTVADARHRLHFVRGRATHEVWERFFDAAVDDPPIRAGIASVQSWARRCEIVWCTGRPERVRDLTRRWLGDNGLPVGILEMYPSGDTRPTREVKADYVRRLAVRRVIAVVVDDDPRVIEMVQNMGIRAQRANWVPWVNPLECDGRAPTER